VIIDRRQHALKHDVSTMRGVVQRLEHRGLCQISIFSIDGPARPDQRRIKADVCHWRRFREFAGTGRCKSCPAGPGHGASADDPAGVRVPFGQLHWGCSWSFLRRRRSAPRLQMFGCRARRHPDPARAPGPALLSYAFGTGVLAVALNLATKIGGIGTCPTGDTAPSAGLPCDLRGRRPCSPSIARAGGGPRT
jgi:hypothetical protein